MQSVFEELCAFERDLAKKRRANLNPSVSEQLRLSLAREPFKDKQDTLKKLMVYHNSYIPISPVSAENTHGFTPAMDAEIVERTNRINDAIADPLTFRNFILSSAARSVRIDLTTPLTNLSVYRPQ